MANGTTQQGEKPEWLSRATPVDKPIWLSRAVPVETQFRPTPEAQLKLQQREQDPLAGQSRFGGLLGLSGPPTRQERFAASGLAEGEGGGFGVRAAAATGSLEDVQRNLGQQFGVSPEQIDVGRVENELVFRNPETGRYEPIDPSGLQIEDITPILTEAPVLALETLGGIGGAVALSPLGPGAATAGAIGGGAAGAAAGRSLVSGALSKLGVTEKTPEEIATEAGKEALIAGAGGAIPVVGSAARYVASPTRRAARRLTSEGVTPELVRSGREAVRELEEETGATFTAGQAISQVEPEIGARLRATEVFAPGPGATREAELARTRRVAREGVQERLQPTREVDVERAGREISDVARQSYEQSLERISNATVQQIDEVNTELAKFSGRGRVEGGAAIRDVLQSGRDKVFNEISQRYSTLWDQVPETTRVDLEGLRKTASKWSGFLDGAIFKSLIPEDQEIIQDALTAGLADAADVGASLSATSLGLSLLKAEKRLLEKNPQLTSIKQSRLLDDFISDLEVARENALKSVDPEIAQQIKETDAAWASAKGAIDEALVGDILKKKKSSSYVVTDDNVLSNIIKSPANVRDYLRVASDYPQLNAVDDIKMALDGDYIDKVINGNQSHQTWMSRNKDVIDQIYSKKEMDRFSSANRLKSAIRISEKNERELISDLKRTIDYDLSSYDPESVFEATKGKPSRARQIRYLLENHPDKWQNYQDVRRQKIVDDLARGKNLNNMLVGDSRRELEVVLGEDYVNNLTRLNKLLEIEKTPTGQRVTRPTSEAPDSLLLVLRNQVFGQLDPTSFRARSFGRFTRAQTDRAAERLLQNPELLERTLELRNARIDSAPAKSLLAQLGLTGYVEAPGATAQEEAEEVK